MKKTERVLDAAERPEGLKPCDALALVLFGVTLLGMGLGSARVLTYHEANFAQPAREMVMTGDWLIPRTIGQPNTHKPPLTHWLIALCMTLCRSQTEWVCRLPSVLAAVGTALWVAWLGTRWYGRRVGLLSGFIQLTPFYVLMQARLAEADMLLCLWVTMAMVLFAAAHIEPACQPCRRRPMVWGFYTAVGLAFMTKFSIGPAFVLGGCGLYILMNRAWPILPALVSPVGWLILLLLLLLWPMLAYRQEPEILSAWWMHNMGRFSGRMGTGAGGWVFYLFMAPALLLPWTPWTVAALWRGRDKGLGLGARGCFFLAWFLAGLLLLTLSAWKAKHYLIPLLPALSIPSAWALVRDTTNLRWPKWRLVALGLAGAALIGFVALRQPGYAGPLLLVALPAVACLVVAVLSAQRGSFRGSFAAIFLACWIVGVGVQLFFMSAFDSYRGQAELARVIDRRAPRGAPLYVVAIPENQIIYYLRFPLERHDQVDEFVQQFRNLPPGTHYIVTDTGQLTTLEAVGRVDILADCPPRRSHLPGLVFLALNVRDGSQGNLGTRDRGPSTDYRLPATDH